jgi:mannose-6-phosphate isomerase
MPSLTIDSLDKQKVFAQAKKLLLSKGLNLIDEDAKRPWGFYLSVEESQAADFIKEFYEGVELAGIDTSLPMRPKLLGIAPGKRLSWQYHHRRAEIWRCLAGSYQIVLSDSDIEAKPELKKAGDVVSIKQGARHRGVGTDEWAFIAEIWQHTDPDKPSNEDDIVRVQDDFGRR